MLFLFASIVVTGQTGSHKQ